MPLDQETIRRITRRGVAEIIDEGEFTRLLQEGKPLRLKMGFDPSRPDIHLGHVVGLRKLRQLQDLGHQVVLIVGDWTAQIGDPSGQSVTRPMLTHEEVVRNAESYMRQFFRVVDRAKTQAVWQSEWFGKFTLADVLRLTSRFTVAQMLQRDDFRSRFEANRPIAITELLYPLLQAYDSVMVQADVEFGGTDQKFNLLVGRELQAMVGQRPQQCFLVPLLVGTDGSKKMSKSLNNYIGVEEPPQEQYGKVMSVRDDLITTYFELLTDVPDGELEEMRQALEGQGQAVNPMLLKKRLAREIVAQFHGQDAAGEAERHFEQLFQRGELPQEVPTFSLRTSLAKWGITREGRRRLRLSHVLFDAGLATSLSEAKRLLSAGAVDYNQRTLKGDGPAEELRPGDVLRVGKRRLVKIVE
ncbi:MAG: tyrosine--tRNA ligase [Chloroflexi bacterium]|nr:tyrosine--tRNA ligase [Chloroflexota bacterium]